MMKRNADFIPADARISLLLHLIEEVARDPGFQDFVCEMASIVEQCQKLLWEPILKCTERNAHQLLWATHQVFAKALPNIAELLIAKEGGKSTYKYNKH